MTNPTFSLEGEQGRKVRLLRVLVIIQVVVGLIFVAVLTTVAISTRSQFLIPGIAASAAFFGVSYAAWRLATVNYALACWLLVSPFMIVAAIVSVRNGTSLPVMPFFMISIAMAISLMKTREIIIVFAISFLFVIVLRLAQDILKIYTPTGSASPTTNAALADLVVMPAVVALIVIPARQQARQLAVQNKQLQEALREFSREERIEKRG